MHSSRAPIATVTRGSHRPRAESDLPRTLLAMRTVSTSAAVAVAALTLVTAPVRNVEAYTTDTAPYTPDPASAVSLTLGTGTCLGVDAR